MRFLHNNLVFFKVRSEALGLWGRGLFHLRWGSLTAILALTPASFSWAAARSMALPGCWRLGSTAEHLVKLHDAYDPRAEGLRPHRTWWPQTPIWSGVLQIWPDGLEAVLVMFSCQSDWGSPGNHPPWPWWPWRPSSCGPGHPAPGGHDTISRCVDIAYRRWWGTEGLLARPDWSARETHIVRGNAWALVVDPWRLARSDLRGPFRKPLGVLEILNIIIHLQEPRIPSGSRLLRMASRDSQRGSLSTLTCSPSETHNYFTFNWNDIRMSTCSGNRQRAMNKR